MTGARWIAPQTPQTLPGAREEDVELVQSPRWLVVKFREPHETASWAFVGGGVRRASTVAWHQVEDGELRPPVDARKLFRRRLREAGLADAIGLLTSRRLDSFADVEKGDGPFAARCIATVGMGNALRAGDPPGPAGRIGTINVLCRLSVPLSPEALLEAMALATEARTLAVREAAIPSTVSGAPASGTGTDCVVIAAPRGGVPVGYAGKHTVVGHLVGASVREATDLGISSWKQDRTRHT